MTVPFGHHVLANRYRFEGTLVVATPLRVSSGVASADTDAPLVRDRAGHIYLPGTSLRGALRSQLERILAGAGTAVGISSCILFTDEDAGCLSVSRSKRDHLGTLAEAPALAYVEQELCDLCKLFGSVAFATRLVIEDAPLTSDPITSLRDGVGIDRDTGTARDGVKFNYEVLESGAKLRLVWRAENLTDLDRKILSLAFGLLRAGLDVGGKRAAGLGRLRLDGDLTATGFEGPEELWAAVADGKTPDRPLAWQEVPLC